MRRPRVLCRQAAMLCALVEDLTERVKDGLGLGPDGVVGVNVDPADDPVCVDDNRGGHRDVVGAVRVCCRYVEADGCCCCESVLASWRVDDAKLARDLIPGIGED